MSLDDILSGLLFAALATTLVTWGDRRCEWCGADVEPPYLFCSIACHLGYARTERPITTVDHRVRRAALAFAGSANSRDLGNRRS
jgi:hypothetical protein